MLSRNGISKLHFLLSLTSCDFWSPFCPFPSFLLSLNSLPQWHTFCNCKMLSSESPFALFPPHSALDLLSDVQPQTPVCTRLGFAHGKGLGEGISYHFSKFLHMQSSGKSLSREMDLGNPFLPAVCRVGTGELQRSPSKMWRPGVFIIWIQFDTALWLHF